MKKKLTLLFAVLTAWLGFSAMAAVGDVITDGTFYFNIVAESDVNEVEFAPKPSGTYTVTNRLIFANNYNAPITIDGVTYNIVGIGEGAFKNAQFPTTSGIINLPTTLRYISDYAFQGVKSGKIDDNDANIRFYGNIETVSPLAFIDNEIVGTINVSNATEHFKQVACTASRIQYNSNNCYVPCKDGNTLVAVGGMGKVLGNGSGGYKCANKLTLASELTIIGPYAMHGNQGYTQLDLGSVEEIQEYALKNSAVEQLTLPATLTTVDPTAFEGATAIFSIKCSAPTPPAGCVFEEVVYATIRNNGRITVPEESLEAYKADPDWGKFWPVTYTVTVADGIENGTVEANKAEAAEGETVTLTITPDDGYQLKTVNVTPETLDLEVVVDENYQFTMPADNVTITAEFELLPPPVVENTVTFEAVIDHANVDVMVDNEPIESGDVVAEGTEVTIVITPEEDYVVDSVTVECVETAEDPDEGPAEMPRRADVLVEGEGNTYTFEMPGAPVIINVSVKYKQSEVPGDLNGDGHVDISDVNICINVILEVNQDEAVKALADLNGDGNVDISDVNAIINIILAN